MHIHVTNGMKNPRALSKLVVFSSLYGIMRLIPMFPIIGVEGGFFSLSDVLTPIYGLILDPLEAAASIVLGVTLSFYLGKPPMLVGLDFLPPTVGSLQAAVYVKKNFRYHPLPYISSLTLFILHPLALRFVEVGVDGLNIVLPFHWMHVGMVVAFTPWIHDRIAYWIRSYSRLKAIVGLFVTSLLATLSQHSTGSVVWATVYGLMLKVMTPDGFKAVWATVFWLYPVERLLIALTSTIILSFLYRSTSFKSMLTCRKL